MERQFSKPSNTHQNTNTEPFFSTKKEEPFFKPTNPRKNPNTYDAKERDRDWLGRQNDQGKFYTGNSDNAKTAHENKEKPNWLGGRELIYITDAGNHDATMGAYWFVDTRKGDDLKTITPKKAFLEERPITEPELKLIKLPNKKVKKPEIKLPEEKHPEEKHPEPKPIITKLTLDVPFKDKRYGFLGDPSKALNEILMKLLENPKNFVSLSPNTAYEKGYDFYDFGGLTGDGDTSDDLVIGRGETIRKWFLDRGVAPSQIIIDTSNSFNKKVNVTGVLTAYE